MQDLLPNSWDHGAGSELNGCYIAGRSTTVLCMNMGCCALQKKRKHYCTMNEYGVLRTAEKHNPKKYDCTTNEYGVLRTAEKTYEQRLINIKKLKKETECMLI